MLKRTALIISIIFITCLSPHAAPCRAAQTDTERLIRGMTPDRDLIREAPAQAPDSMYFDSYYEHSDILQGNRTGHWSELTLTYGYSRGKVKGYGSFSRYERLDNRDFAATMGAYFNLPSSYLHTEFGAGWYIDYIYRLQLINEYGHKLYENLYWQIGYNFRSYRAGNTHIVYPGLIYYFGDSYVAADYGQTWIEGRDTGGFANFKSDFAITEFLRAWAGVAVGCWLYDIYGLPSQKETGFMLSAGLKLKVYKDIFARAGYSYSEEAPKFIKRSISFGLSARF